jgi:hemerythrin superfamily protein
LSNSTSEGSQVRKTVSFSKKRDKDLIKLQELQDDFSYNAKQLMRDGLRFRQLMQNQNINLNHASIATTMTNYIPQEDQIEEKVEEKVEPKQEKVATNMQDFLNSKTKNTEISEEDKARLEKNLDF